MNFPITEITARARKGPVVIYDHRLYVANGIDDTAQNFFMLGKKIFELRDRGHLSALFRRYAEKNEEILYHTISKRMAEVSWGVMPYEDKALRKKELLFSYLESLEELNSEKKVRNTRFSFSESPVENTNPVRLPFDILFNNKKLILINEGVYNLCWNKKDKGIVKINNGGYTSGDFIGDLDNFEELIDKGINDYCRAEAIQWIGDEAVRLDRDFALDKKIKSLSHLVTINNGIYDYDSFGFDSDSGLLLRYLPEFREGYNKKSYEHHESAVAISLLERGNIENPGCNYFFAERNDHKYVPAQKPHISCSIRFDQLIKDHFGDNEVHPIRKVMAYISTVADAIIHAKRIND